jgi:hypothetical protein
MKELENFRKFITEEESFLKNQYVVKDEEMSQEFGEDWYIIDKNKALQYLSQFNRKGEVSAKGFMKDDEGWGEFESNIEDVQDMTNQELEDAMRQEMSFYFYSKPDEI